MIFKWVMKTMAAGLGGKPLAKQLFSRLPPNWYHTDPIYLASTHERRKPARLFYLHYWPHFYGGATRPVTKKNGGHPYTVCSTSL